MYGSGQFGSSLDVYNPFAAAYRRTIGFMANIHRKLKESEGPDYIPFEIYPISPGLLPFAHSIGSRDKFFWLTDGPPDTWPIILMGEDWKGNVFERWNMSMTSLLSRLFRGELESVIKDQNFARQNFAGIKFVPKVLF